MALLHSCQKKVGEEKTPSIVLEKDMLEIPSESGSYGIGYVIENPVPNAVIKVDVPVSDSWISNVRCTEDSIKFDVSQNENPEVPRQCTFTLSYPGAENVSLSVVQSVYEYPESPVKVSVLSVSYYYASMEWKTEDPEMTYISLIMEKSKMDELKSDAEIFASDIEFYNGLAEVAGMSLIEYIETFDVLYKGDMKATVKNLRQNTDEVVYCYAVSVKNGTLVRESAIYKESFRTKKLEMMNVDFSLDAEMTSNKLTLKASPEDKEITYMMNLFTEKELASYQSLEQAAKTYISQVELLVNSGAYKWEDFVFKGEASRTFTNLKANHKYEAIAFAVDDAVLVSEVQSKSYTIPYPDPQDNCTFDVTVTENQPTFMELSVKPSNPDTKYIVTVKESSAFNDTYTPQDYIADLIYNKTHYENTDWSASDNKYLNSGDKVFNTSENIMEPAYLKADTQYTIMICGISPDGERSTELSLLECISGDAVQKDLDIQIEITGVEAKAIHAVFRPSDEEANYHLDCYPLEDYLEYESDEAFMESVIKMNGEYLELYKGEVTKDFRFYFPRSEYIVFAFGYDGKVMTKLFSKKINMLDGTVSDM